MRCLRTPFLPVCALILALVGPCLAQAGFQLDRDQLRTDMKALTAQGHRLAGSPEGRAAARYLSNRIRAIGPDQFIEQPFPMMQLVTKKAEAVLLDARGRETGRLDLVPLRPNGLIPPSTPRGGIAGPVHYGGKGHEPIPGPSLQGSVVAYDRDAGDAWLRAFRRGARAVIFLERGDPRAQPPVFTLNNANLPRFLLEGDPSPLLAADHVRIQASITWEWTTGRNLVAYVAGTDPVLNLERPEVILLGARLDTFGQVPERAPGARSAANAAALLQVMEHFKQARPARNLAFVFMDNLAYGHLGGSYFARAMDRERRRHTMEEQDRALNNAESFVRELGELFASEEPLAESTEAGDELRILIRKEADVASNRVRLQMAGLRERIDAADPDASPADLKRRLEALDVERLAWSDFKRALNNQTLNAETRPQLEVALERVRRDIAAFEKSVVARRANLNADMALRDLLHEQAISLFLSFEFGDNSDHWGLMIGGSGAPARGGDSPGLYVPVQSVFREIFDADPSAFPNFVTATADTSLSPPSMFFAGRQFLHPGEPLGKLAIFNVALTTAQDAFDRDGTVLDTIEQFAFDPFERQLATAVPFLDRLVDHSGLSRRNAIKRQAHYLFPEMAADYRIVSPRALGRMPGQSLADTPMGGAVIQVRDGIWENNEQRARRTFQTGKSAVYNEYQVIGVDALGGYAIGPLASDWRGRWGIGVRLDEQGIVAFATNRDTLKNLHRRLVFYPARHGVLPLPAKAIQGKSILYDGDSNSVVDTARRMELTFDGVFSWFHDRRTERVKVYGVEDGHFALNVPPLTDEAVPGQQVKASAGSGFPADPLFDPIPVGLQGARDFVRLDNRRLEALRSNGLRNNAVDTLHGEATDLLQAAENAPTPDKGEALAMSAYLTERSVYEDTRSTIKDLVTAVLLLLLLVIPFAFAMERLLIGATIIYKQVLGFCAFFLLAFFALYLTHPAFALAATPLVIFLGFTILLLSSLVIVIIMQKFEVELKAVQGLAGTVHAADVSRVGTILAAMQMGISTMRRRPVRTFLTAVTILLLTYTILTFASFGSSIGTLTYREAVSPGYAGAVVHRPDWRGISTGVLDVLEGRFKEEATVAPRAWYHPQQVDPGGRQAPINQGLLIAREDLKQRAVVRGIVGLTAEEVAARPDWRQLLGEDAGFDNRIWITEALGGRLGVAAGDRVRIGGRQLTVGSLLNAPELVALTDMDGDPVLPVDLSQVAPGAQADAGEEVETGGDASYTLLAADSVVLMPYDLATEMGAGLRMVHIYTDDPQASSRIAEIMTRVVNLPVSGTREDGVYLHVFGTLVEASGVGDLFFPVLLGGLVIFGTMLGSVADREKEIYTFSALGLAPTHVASLFFAEALVFSVIGGMGGYLFAQVLMVVLEWLAGFGLITVPEMNYSSTNAVVTILIVMATVLLSSLYPAMKASRSANPGVMRGWQLPEPEGDRLNIVFPFTVSRYDITGVVSFLKEHFETFADTSMGTFMARDAWIGEKDDHLVLTAFIALAPFDLGVTQDFHLTSAPSEVPGIEEVRLTIRRRSGQVGDWKRLNRPLMDNLRKQFLIWRSLPADTMETYRHRTLEALGETNAHHAERTD
ncbi:MAG: FtsX-like permease family protein [Opitutales bacterium]